MDKLILVKYDFAYIMIAFCSIIVSGFSTLIAALIGNNLIAIITLLLMFYLIFFMLRLLFYKLSISKGTLEERSLFKKNKISFKKTIKLDCDVGYRGRIVHAIVIITLELNNGQHVKFIPNTIEFLPDDVFIYRTYQFFKEHYPDMIISNNVKNFLKFEYNINEK